MRRLNFRHFWAAAQLFEVTSLFQHILSLLMNAGLVFISVTLIWLRPPALRHSWSRTKQHNTEEFEPILDWQHNETLSVDCVVVSCFQIRVSTVFLLKWTGFPFPRHSRSANEKHLNARQSKAQTNVIGFGQQTAPSTHSFFFSFFFWHYDMNGVLISKLCLPFKLLL